MKGVYVIVGSIDTWRQRAIVAYLAVRSAGGVISHVTAAALHGLMSALTLPHVTVPRTASARCPLAKVHRSRLPAEDLCWADGMRATSVSRTIVDLAATLDGTTLEEVVDVALCGRTAAHGSVLAAANRVGAGRQGLARLRRVLEVWTPGIKPGSVAEIRLPRLLSESGLDEIETQHRVYSGDGELVGRLDVAIPRLCAGLEYDGLSSHNPRRWERDERRYQRLDDLGWQVDSVSKLDLLPGEARLRNIVERWRTRRAA
ncbi:MAG: hypothetical protein ACRD0G_09245 [Acidimicrobiales bacterium]